MPIFMKIDTIEGDCTRENYYNWFEVLSFAWGENLATTTGGPGGGGTSQKVNIQDFSVVKYAGKGSPLIMLACASGRHLPAVQIVKTMEGGEEQVFEHFTLTNCMISSYHIGADGGSVPVESISFNFAKIEFLQRFQSDDGQWGHQLAYWDKQNNRGG